MASWDLTQCTTDYIMEPLRRAYAHLLCALEDAKSNPDASVTFPSSHMRICDDSHDTFTMSYFMRYHRLTVSESVNFDRLRGQSKTLVVNSQNSYHETKFQEFYHNTELQAVYQNPRTFFTFFWDAYERQPDKGIRYVGELIPHIVDATGSRGLAVLMLWLQHVPLYHKCRFMYELAVSQAFCRWMGFHRMNIVQAVQMYESTWGVQLPLIKAAWDGHD